MKNRRNNCSLSLNPKPSVFIFKSLWLKRISANEMKTIIEDKLQNALPTLC